MYSTEESNYSLLIKNKVKKVWQRWLIKSEDNAFIFHHDESNKIIFTAWNLYENSRTAGVS